MANYGNNYPQWGNNAPAVDEYRVQVRPMGLKVQYTFDKDCQERCLARWPHILHIQTIPMDNQNSIGVVDLRTCLQAVAQCSPELIGDSEKDYTVYALDYSEPDTPLVGQGMLSWGLGQAPNIPNAQQLVTGRVTRSMLALFGKGPGETLEVRLKLTAVSRIARSNPAPPQRASAEPTATQRTPTPTPSENTEWNSFRQSHPNLGQQRGPVNSVPTALAPTPPFYSNYEARNDMMPSSQRPQSQGPQNQGLQTALGSRPASVELGAGNRRGSTSFQGLNILENQNRVAEGVPPAPVPTKGGKPQSRPASRASSRPPSGRPRGRPRKRPLPIEGSTSGYEDGTDADDGPPQSKKRATTTMVERNNTATFGSAPESLRVAASTAGSIRNFRPVGVVGDGVLGNNNGQGIPRAPTPIPDPLLPGFPHARPMASSSLRRESMPGPGMDRSFAPSYLELNRSASYSQDARSPTYSAGISPSQIYSDEPSPADIGSSPPVPRSARYSVRSSPVPSSPILPPMLVAMPQPDSGYMSGGIEESHRGDESINKLGLGGTIDGAPTAPVAPKPKPRRSRAKKALAKVQKDFVIHTETPGPPELLPQTSIYNPPHLSRKNSESARTPIASEPPSLPTVRKAPSEQIEQEKTQEQPPKKATSVEAGHAQRDLTGLEIPSIINWANDQSHQYPNSVHLADDLFSPAAEDSSKLDSTKPVAEASISRMNPPTLLQPRQEAPVEPELPVVPASDPVLSQLTFPTLASEPAYPQTEPAHPQTDAPGPADEKSNKNYVKRQTIRQKLEEAIAQGQPPSFCRNCGAVQTPTWRKIWKQKHGGVPAYHEYSEKPGMVTAINIIERDVEGKPTSYEVIKKSLGPADQKSAWTEVLLCNPCGIWFSKFKQPRPSEKWEKDEQRLSQTRKKRTNGGGLPRSKKARTKNDAQANLTSEACFPTDPLGLLDGPPSPKDSVAGPSKQTKQQGGAVDKKLGKGREGTYLEGNSQGSTYSRGSLRSRGSGTPGSPIAVEDDLGPTRRLLFPSPRKDGEQKILGEVAVNIVQASPEYHNAKGEGEVGKENIDLATHDESAGDDDFVDLFGTPPRPSTPAPKVNSSGPFKTPTHPTPSHRPITRSVTRSMRSGGTINSPSQILMAERTPTRTPRSSMAKRHSPSDLLSSHLLNQQVPDSPMTTAINQLLTENHQFVMNSPSSSFKLELCHFDPVDEELANRKKYDFGSLLDTDGPVTNSPPSSQPLGSNIGFTRSLENSGLRGSYHWQQMSAGRNGNAR
ncbi:hypothetical protein F4677DRAFT_142614 [Hypoxylon crocopeplum]|nr:hypothetical protein F4677DRAFT_142614 [Hypoxylon crocopeplum]